MQIAFPYVFDSNRLTGLADERSHVRHLLELLLFTIPGERVNRPDFGCGIQRAVFAPQNVEMLATLNTLVKSEVHRWLGDLLTLERLDVSSDDATLTVDVSFRLVSNDMPVDEQFRRGV